MPKLLTVLSLGNDIGLDKCSTVALRTSVDSDNVGRGAILDGAERGGEICLCPEMSGSAGSCARTDTVYPGRISAYLDDSLSSERNHFLKVES
ncbi:hypothetical protein ATR01nite_20000 [Acetobacter tropicalis]|uniref:Uncharacterized protein n=1 Tax=Acetobacter tropicalis TaxID=104102 RepID=A0A511FPP6_9PROT|nr:hypothetical protein ATR01nite_20000 [Acetobacter tropicalis]